MGNDKAIINGVTKQNAYYHNLFSDDCIIDNYSY